MNSNDYIKNALKTESQNFDEIESRLKSKKMLQTLHAAMGVSTEAGELLDAVKKHVYYGKKLDEVNMLEEVGDLFWYLAILADELGFDFKQAMEKNINKLQARYGEKFSEERAITRNLSQERSTLEH